MKKYWLEVHGAAYYLVHDLLKVKRGESVAVTIDTESDPQVADAVAGAATALGAKPFIFTVPTPSGGVGKAADPDLPVDALSAALAASDVWVEFNNQWLLYSTPHERALAAGKVRHICLVGMDADMMIRTIGRVSIDKYLPFWSKLAELTANSKEMTITTPAGTDLRFRNHPETASRPATGMAETPGSHMLGGQIGWTPELETIEGILVFDGALTPPLGKLEDPVKLEISEGVVQNITGGSSAVAFANWLQSLDDPNMYRLAHVCYGFNPGAKLTGNIVEDERVWGATEWGLGYKRPSPVVPDGIPAKSHTDGICLQSTVESDFGTLIKDGEPVHPELVRLLEH